MATRSGSRGSSLLLALGTLAAVVVAPAHAVTYRDATVDAHVKLALDADPDVNGVKVARIEVTSDDGRVALRGRVASAQARERATETALRVPGVKAIENHLELQPLDAVPDLPDDELTPTVARLLRRTNSLKGGQIRVRVEKGLVHLTGRVPSLAEQVIASDVARSVVGIKAVHNRLWPDTLGLERPKTTPRPPEPAR